MTKSQLHRAVARATGDDHHVIMYRGFSLVDEESPLHDDDIEALIADWDQIDAEEITSPYRHGDTTLSVNRVPRTHATKSRSLRNKKAARAAAKIRRMLNTLH